MTIAVGVATPDGLVLAADSRSTKLDNHRHYRIASDNAQKLFNVKDRIGVATYGEAFLGRRTIAGLMTEFIAGLDLASTEGEASIDTDQVVEQLAEHFDALVRQHVSGANDDQVALGFLVAAYNGGPIGSIHEIELPGPHVRVLTDTDEHAATGVVVRGQKDAALRLLYGVDFELLDELGVELNEDVLAHLKQLEYIRNYAISLQDALDLATFVVRMTIDAQRFTDGTRVLPGLIPSCGGPIRAMAITTAGVEWVANPPLAVDPHGGVAEGRHR